jgi:hypothetical protein
MKLLYIIVLLVLPCVLISMKCTKRDTDHCHYRFDFTNNSDKNVYVAVSYDYPDTSLNFQDPREDAFGDHIQANKTQDVYNPHNCIESILLDNAYEKMSIFVFDAELLETTSWRQVRQNYQVLKRYDYTLDELRSIDFKIVYP